MPYDNYHTCPKCGGSNQLKEKSTDGFHIAEAETECEACGHKNYWAYGYYEHDPNPDAQGQPYADLIKPS